MGSPAQLYVSNRSPGFLITSFTLRLAAFSCTMPFRTLEAAEADIPAMVAIELPAFADNPVNVALEGQDTPEDRKRVSEKISHALQSDPTLHLIKCVTVDPRTKEEKVMGCCEWQIFRTEEEAESHSRWPMRLRTCHVSDDGERQQIDNWLKPIMDARVEHMKLKPHAVLHFMCVDPAYRRQGVGSACVRWGMEQCSQLGIPAYLEASELGKPMYEKLGWERVGDVQIDVHGSVHSFPAMVFKP